MTPMIRLLGYAGLIPFVGLTALITLTGGEDGARLNDLFLHYSGIILGFMAGVLWPVLYHSERRSHLALVAVTPAVLAFLIIALVPQWALVSLAGVFLALRMIERIMGIDARYPQGYTALRWQLTAVVVACHLWLSAVI
ncbi:MAG: DUF3429 domain-containing protein [Saccharospirillum sp.]